MAQLLVRNLEEDVKEKLRQRALRHGHSTEEEVRQILRSAVLTPAARKGLGSRIAAHFSQAGFEGEIEELRGGPPRPADFDESGHR